MHFVKAIILVICVGIQDGRLLAVPQQTSHLINIADSNNASLTQISLKQIRNGAFGGSGRITPSYDVVVINKTNKKFQLRSHSCVGGIFSSGLSPEPYLPSRRSIAYGAESSNNISRVHFETIWEELAANGETNGNEFTLYVEHPYAGYRQWPSQETAGFKIEPVLEHGRHSTVQFVISEVAKVESKPPRTASWYMRSWYAY